jgi:hypothetical protein
MTGHATLPRNLTLHDFTSMCYYLGNGAAELGLVCKDKSGKPHPAEFTEHASHFLLRVPISRIAPDLKKWPELVVHQDRMVYMQIYKTGTVRFITVMDCENLVMQRFEYFQIQFGLMVKKVPVDWIPALKHLGRIFEIPPHYKNGKGETIFHLLNESTLDNRTEEEITALKQVVEACFQCTSGLPVLRQEVLATLVNAFSVEIPQDKLDLIMKEAQMAVKKEEAKPELYNIGDEAIEDLSTKQLKELAVKNGLDPMSTRDDLIISLQLKIEPKTDGQEFEEEDEFEITEPVPVMRSFLPVHGSRSSSSSNAAPLPKSRVFKKESVKKEPRNYNE